jgi:hypothetical protein
MLVQGDLAILHAKLDAVLVDNKVEAQHFVHLWTDLEDRGNEEDQVSPKVL